jgi:hypothetical protein
MGKYQLGRLPAVRPAALSDLEVYATGKLPNPPATREVPKASYPIDCNDRIGDCTYAGVDHLNRGWNALLSEKDKLPTEAQIEGAYFKETGGEDSGCNEASVLKRWYREGLFGAKIAGYAPVSTTNMLAWHQAVAFYGGLYLGIECPASAQEQFEAGQPWTYVGSEVEGGHCVVALGYGPNGGLHCATWGGIAVLEASFLAHYLDEAWVILPHQLVEAKKDSLGIDLEALQADLAKV